MNDCKYIDGIKIEKLRWWCTVADSAARNGGVGATRSRSPNLRNRAGKDGRRRWWRSWRAGWQAQAMVQWAGRWWQEVGPAGPLCGTEPVWPPSKIFYFKCVSIPNFDDNQSWPRKIMASPGNGITLLLQTSIPRDHTESINK
ncbi:hypothetical protein [Oryza sativa Japonica Group]|uniref:Uncharacterized protein n=2 Tax=Oryza sativa subsp. japonica TaxID=39947 RepID=Q5ZCP2_ORYSJ|nr:hypothetical protein [Oryza sativa Japonica Group]BAD53919.1 hypothetical protein [Oryza sativa Japonica Group]